MKEISEAVYLENKEFTDLIMSKIERRFKKDKLIITPELILKEVAAVYSISVEAIRSENRLGSIVSARKTYCYLSRKMTGYGVVPIGKVINRHHASTIHLTRCCDNELNLYPNGKISILTRNVEKKLLSFYKLK